MRLAAVFLDQRYSMMNLEKVNVVAADGSKAIAMFKLPGGAVVAQGSQQPDRKFPALSKKRIWEVLRERAVKRLSKIDDNSANNEILQQKEKALDPPLIPAVGRAPLICILTYFGEESTYYIEHLGDCFCERKRDSFMEKL